MEWINCKDHMPDADRIVIIWDNRNKRVTIDRCVESHKSSQTGTSHLFTQVISVIGWVNL